MQEESTKSCRAPRRRARQVKKRVTPGIILRLNQMHSPEIARTIKELQAKYGRYAVPIAELRKQMGQAMGARTLTEELEAIREGQVVSVYYLETSALGNSYRRVREVIGEPLYFVSADARLNPACVAGGINIINPEQAPGKPG